MCLSYAAHAGDHTIYPDCRPQFTDAMEKALSCQTGAKSACIDLLLIGAKAELVKRGKDRRTF